MSDRVECKACGKWMFHLASKCPHCGAVNRPVMVDEVAKPAGPKKELTLTAEEAKALLSTAQPKERSDSGFAEVVAQLVLPRGGAVDAGLSMVALLVTAPTVLSLAGAMRAARRRGADFDFRGAKLLAVPSSAGLYAVTLWQLEAPRWAWWVLAVAVLAWLVREVLRARGAPQL